MENFAANSTLNYKRVLEVFEAIETAVTKLKSLDVLQFLKYDSSLMRKIVLKLTVADQRHSI